MSTQPEKQVQNGVNVEALLGARDALSKAPEAAKFNWRASCKWMGTACCRPTKTRSTICGASGGCR